MLILHLVCASFDLFVTIGILPVVQPPILAGYPLGFFYTLGVPSYVQSYIAVTILLMLGPAVTMFFESRYNVLVRRDSEAKSRKIKRAIHNFANYLFTILVFAPTVFDMPSVSETRRIFMEKLPCLPTEILDRPGYTMLGNLSTTFKDNACKTRSPPLSARPSVCRASRCARSLSLRLSSCVRRQSRTRAHGFITPFREEIEASDLQKTCSRILKTSRATKSLIHHNSVHFYATTLILPPFERSLQA
ncbi:hypothetical protein B9Z55_020938 [Caenorhabditis nigoni]|nr:hypothetical protein B9Z55_020938 [Caenorhabditis nigoni]